MYKYLFIGAVLAVLASAAAIATVISPSAARSGDITSAQANDGRLEVVGWIREQGWLGLTVRHGGRTHDFRNVCNVSRNFNEFWNLTSFKGRGEWQVSLWERRVDKCGCSYCDANGFHLEGRIATRSGTFRNP